MESVGGLLRAWRHRRRLSQLDLALLADVSARHVSLVETGRSRPSADMVLRLAARLDVPLRERNRLLLAAGFAPRYTERPLAERDMSAVRGALERVLRAHEPYPALVIDRGWNLVTHNRAVAPLLEDVDPELLRPPANLVRLGLDRRGLASRIVNLADVRAFLRARISRRLAREDVPGLAAVYDEYLSSETGEDEGVSIDAEIAMSMVFRFGGGELRLFSTTTVFGDPRDITLEGIAIESYYPADESSAALLRAAAEASPVPSITGAPPREEPGRVG